MADPLAPDDFTQIDNRIDIVTPENIAFEYHLAGPWRRLPAYLIDGLIQTGVVLGLALVAEFIVEAGLPGFGSFVLLVGVFALQLLYGALFETLWNGQTPGKRALNLRVVTVEGLPISGGQAVLRNLLRFVDALPLIESVYPCYLVGLASATITARYQRLGDLAAGTIVVAETSNRQHGVMRVTLPEAVALAAQLPAALRISRGLARALAGYVERREWFSWPRRTEMAMHVAGPMRIQLGLPNTVHPDLLLCALYHRAFIADGGGRAETYPAPGTSRGTTEIAFEPVSSPTTRWGR